MATINGTNDPDRLVGTAGDDNIRGYGGDDILIGLGGNDILNGDTGVDRLTGGTGDDLYIVDNPYDTVVEKAGEGFDRVLATSDYTLAAGQSIEELTTRSSLDTANINLTGNEIANILFGDVGDNIFDGGGGVDALYGRSGDDTYRVDNAGDRVIEKAGEGDDTVVASVSYALAAGQEIERLQTASANGTAAIDLTGNEFVNTLVGNAGSNILDGRGGADIMAGGAGDDLYYVDDVHDSVTEATDGGTDRVLTTVNYTLAAGQAIETLSTRSSRDTANINLTGNEFGNSLWGDAGNNVLDGGSGADSLYGRGGDDIYYVDNAKDRVIEAAGGGNDTVIASVSYALTAGQEIETLETSARRDRETRINLTGNEFDNILTGNDSVNVLDGGAGADIMTGGYGNDSYYVDNPGDQIIDPVSNGFGSIVYTSISFVAGDNQGIGGVFASDVHSTDPINLSGNYFGNALIGNDGDNRLTAKSGYNRVTGNGGADTFVACAPNGTRHTVDVLAITDFANSTNAVHDTLFLPAQLFPLLHPGPLDPSQLYIGPADAAPAGIPLILDNGDLEYKVSGQNQGPYTDIALFLNNTPITAADIFVG